MLSSVTSVLGASEAKSLVALLHSNDEVLLERTLVTIANCGTFAGNQVTHLFIYYISNNIKKWFIDMDIEMDRCF